MSRYPWIVSIVAQALSKSTVVVNMLFVSVGTSVIAPVHLLTYSALLGTELYQSFVMTKLAYQSLSRSAFTSLQKRVFPVYFQGQSLLLITVALTVPPYGPASLVRSKRDWIPLAIAGGTAGLNLLVYGPRTKDLMIQRVHQGTLYLSYAIPVNEAQQRATQCLQ
jgi:hypothetical protein